MTFLYFAIKLNSVPIMSASSVNSALKNSPLHLVCASAETLIGLRFSHLNSVHFAFEERDLCISAVIQTRTNIQYPFEVFLVSLCISVFDNLRAVL